MHSKDTDEDRVRLNNLRISAAKTVIGAQLRVDEHSLRRKQIDVLPKLLAEMEAQRKLLGV